MKKIFSLIFIAFIIILASCDKATDFPDNGAVMSSSDISGKSYKFLTTIDECDVSELNDYNNILLYEYNNIEQEVLSSFWTINYERSFDYVSYGDVDLEIVDKLYEYVKDNISYFEEKLQLELKLYDYDDEINIEEAISNPKDELLTVHVYDLYIPFSINNDGYIFFVGIPVKTYYLRGYENEMEDLNNNFITYEEFNEKYNQ